MQLPAPYYEARIREFRRRLESEPSETVEGLLRTALSRTNATAVRFTELADLAKRIKPLVKQLWEQTASNIDDNLKNARELMTRLNKIAEDPNIDPELKKSVSRITYQAVLSGKTTATASVDATDIFVQAFRISITVLVDTLSLKLLRPDHTEFNANAVREGLRAAVEALPVIGDFASAIQSIRNVLLFSDDQFQAAVDYTSYLEKYIRAAELWNEAATTIITLYGDAITRETGEA
jgi:hypothetical protein